MNDRNIDHISRNDTYYQLIHQLKDTAIDFHGALWEHMINYSCC